MSYKKNLCVFMLYKKNLCVYTSFSIKRHIYTSVISWCAPVEQSLLVNMLLAIQLLLAGSRCNAFFFERTWQSLLPMVWSSTNHGFWILIARGSSLPACQSFSLWETSLSMLLPAASLCLFGLSSHGGFSSLSRSGSQSSSLISAFLMTTCKPEGRHDVKSRGGCDVWGLWGLRAPNGGEERREM